MALFSEEKLTAYVQSTSGVHSLYQELEKAFPPELMETATALLEDLPHAQLDKKPRTSK